jgi:PAS domain S-box-containing protein
MRRWAWLWLAAGLLLLGVCGYLLPHTWLDPEAHNTYQQELRDARQLDREINEAVLRVRLGLLNDYDPLVANVAGLKRAHTSLQNMPDFLQPGGRNALRESLATAEQERTHKAALIEEFKTQFAVLRNSLIYFPTLIAETSNRVVNRPDGPALVSLLNNILNHALIYHLTTSAENEAYLRTDVNLLQSHLEEKSAAPGENADLRLVLAHANVILLRKPVVDAALGEVANLPTSQIYDAMQMRYDAEYTAALARWQSRRLVVYITSLVLLVGVFSLIIRQFVRSGRELREAEEKFRSIFEKAGEGIFQTTPDGRYLAANPALSQFYGYDSSEELMQAITDIKGQLYVDPKRREAFQALLDKDGEVFDFESEIRRKDGSVAWISENAHAVRDKGGKLLYYEGIVDEITLRKRSEYDRERRNQRELLHQRCLLGLAQFDKSDFQRALCEILDTTAYTLGVNRVSAWQLDDPDTAHESIKLLGLFDLDKREHRTHFHRFMAADYPRYFTALKGETCIVAPDAMADPRMNEFADDYLKPRQICSTIDVPVWAQGRLAGLLALERTVERHQWEDDEIDFAVSAANLVAVCFESAERLRAQQEAARERERAEQLLLNILPGSIARRLQEGEGLIADHFPEATVLFADIVGFTELSAGIAPQAVVGMLNEIFSSFDQLAQDHNLEKIKTIGDAYMVVGGVPVPRADHTEAVVEMALQMIECCAELNKTAKMPVEMRIGINSGPVVAGVIGIKKFIYDLWGDTVNLASRMESHGVSGQIQVTEAVYEQLRDKYAFIARGSIEVKGRGQQNVYLLKGRVEDRATVV